MLVYVINAKAQDLLNFIEESISVRESNPTLDHILKDWFILKPEEDGTLTLEGVKPVRKEQRCSKKLAAYPSIWTCIELDPSKEYRVIPLIDENSVTELLISKEDWKRFQVL